MEKAVNAPFFSLKGKLGIQEQKFSSKKEISQGK